MRLCSKEASSAHRVWSVGVHVGAAVEHAQDTSPSPISQKLIKTINLRTIGDARAHCTNSSTVLQPKG